jgi:tetratricopeptide (TPR) repeat protein
MLLISDFGRTLLDNHPEQSLTSQFGTTCAFTVSFPLLTPLTKHRAYLTDYPPGSPQVLLFDNTPGKSKIPSLFNQLFARYERPDFDAYLALADQLSKSKHPTKKRFAKLFNSVPPAFKSDFQLLNNFAQYLLQANLPETALDYADQALTYHYHIALTTYRIKAMAHAQLGHKQAMEQNFKLALEVAPSDFQTLAFLAEIYWKENRFADFLGIMRTYLQFTRNRDYVKSLLYIAKALWTLGSYKESVAVLRALVAFADTLHHRSAEDNQLLESAREQLLKSTTPPQSKA